MKQIFKIKYDKKYKESYFIIGICFIGLILGGYFHINKQKYAIKAISLNWTNAKPDLKTLQTGDLILRYGKGFISDAFREFSRKDSRYSHAGIISIENGRVYVYHAIGGEENASNKLKKSTLEDFCNPQSIYEFGIYRFSLNNKEEKQVQQLAESYYKSGLEFDLKFDLNTDDKMYCSEFIYKIITRVKHDINYLSLSELNGVRYVAIDDLYMNKNCRFIYSHIY